MRKYKGKYYDLHVHTTGSLLDGAIKIEDLVEKYTDGGGIADHGQAYELINFYKSMKSLGKKPILGVEVYTENILNRFNNDIDISRKGRINHLVLIAKNNDGLKNLFRIVTESNAEKIEGKPLVKLEHLNEYGNDLVVLSGCLGSELCFYLKNNDYEKAKEIANFFKKKYKDDYYLEIQRHETMDEVNVNPLLIKLSKELNIKLVATSDAHYLNEEDSEIHEILLCIGTKKKITDENRFRFEGKNYHLPTISEMEERFKDLPEALDSTVEIFNKCNVYIHFPKGNIDEYHIPKVNVPHEYIGIESKYFKMLCQKGFEERFNKYPDKKNNKEYIDRLNYEVETIADMKYTSYFLNLKEILNIADNLGIYIGPGRGSASGSLVSYCLGITDLDPLEYGLLFERFLNKERVSMPDIDTDIEDSRRDELINAIKQSRGDDYVTQIATFGTLGAKESIRSVVRVMDYGYSFGDKISKAIPSTPGVTISQALELSPELSMMYNQDTKVKKVIDYAKKIEGLKRNLSTHACGIVIADKPICEYLPLVKVDDNWVTQVYMNTVEEMGLLKMDMLGLKTLTVIRKTIELIEERYSDIVKYREIPVNDIYVYKDIISKGLTDSVFQLESIGMKAFIKELYSDIEEIDVESLTNQEKIEKGNELFERMIAGISLYRPGPMESIPQYLRNMKNKDNIKYDHELLTPILENTYGVIIYQEQVMQIVQQLAGYSLGSADIIRRAMGKKEMEVMKKNKQIFIYGEKVCPDCKGMKNINQSICFTCNGDGKIPGDKNNKENDIFIIPGAINKNINEDIAEKIFDVMIDFAKYSFNKSHAAAYAMLSLKTAYLKKYYKLEYMTANLNCVIKDSKKLRHYLQACKNMNIKILKPCINVSNGEFVIEGDSIRFGLEGIKHLGKSSLLIEEERLKNGKFKSYQDFVSRMSKNNAIDKTVLESTIYSGALDVFEGSRKAKLEILNNMLELSKNIKKMNSTDQISLFDEIFINSQDEEIIEQLNSIVEVETPDIKEFSKKEKLLLEKEYAGLYISEHPLDSYKIQQDDLLCISSIIENLSNNSLDKNKCKCLIILKDLVTKYSKNGNKYMIGKIEDQTGEIDILIFEKTIDRYIEKLKDDEIVIVEGNVEEDDFGIKMRVNKIISPFVTNKALIIYIDDVENYNINKSLNNISNLLNKYKGNHQVFICLRNDKIFKFSNLIDIDDPLLIKYIDKYYKYKYKFY